MARRELLTHLLTEDDNTTPDLDASFVTQTTYVNGLDRFAYQIDWSGTTVNGEFTVEISLGTTQGLSTETPVWETLTFPSGSIFANTDSGTHFIDIVQTGAKLARLRYTRTSGTGSINIKIGGSVSGS